MQPLSAFASADIYLQKPLLHPAIYGAYTELWSAVATELSLEDSGAYIWPWGRLGDFRADIKPALSSLNEGGLGLADRFLHWCEQVTANF